jgi:hypothetical protein
VNIDDLFYAWDGGAGDTIDSITAPLYYAYSAFKLVPRSASDVVATVVSCPADKCAEDLVSGDLIVTEIMKDPAMVDDTDGEWFEVYNASGGSVNLDGFGLYDDGSDATTLTSSDVFAAGAYIVLCRDADLASNGGLPCDIEYSGFNLANGDDEVGLGSAASSVDWVGYDDATFPDTAGASMALDYRYMGAGTNDDGSYWCDGTASYGDGDLGSPGARNSACP